MSMSVGPTNNPYNYGQSTRIKKVDDSPNFNPNEPVSEKVLHGHVKVKPEEVKEKDFWDRIIDWVKSW